jgi:hypothetical protein
MELNKWEQALIDRENEIDALKKQLDNLLSALIGMQERLKQTIDAARLK